jgi:hypothetical protein
MVKAEQLNPLAYLSAFSSYILTEYDGEGHAPSDISVGTVDHTFSDH